ncbi:MAG: DNA-directed RNA polymerase subunit omega [Gemmatimonadota bacterium]|nr:DNA-directed RNA polymerase subunit omega [Gemmatimonadota bacterium]
MRVFTPQEIAEHNQSKYQGVLVAAKYARQLNFLMFRGEAQLDDQKKLSTRALEAIKDGRIDYRLVKRRRPESE